MKNIILVMVFCIFPMVAASGELSPRPSQKEEIGFVCSNLNCLISPPDEILRPGRLKTGYDVYDLIPQPQKLRIK